MKADEISLQNLMNSNNQYVIPVFQRYYNRNPETVSRWAHPKYRQMGCRTEHT